ncbi:hypothetical protein GE061_015265 [Apolygus lucorum]|uniref:Kazal-like domain-containing protein n=1 Tax=Apolygus lucorum TaxID=248454 RepID=A0A8S9XMP5_APOLU|nr:hypothetical protein GE061_015265 [Apolygus lucorum]
MIYYSPSSKGIIMKLLYFAVTISVAIAVMMNGALAALEECPTNCGPTHDAYGKACGNVDNFPRTFQNLCVFFRDRCASRKINGPVFEFLHDGPCWE